MHHTPTVHIVFGPLGAGKSTIARQLAAQNNAVRFSIDEWMIQLFGADLPKSMSSSWMENRVRRCEAKIWAVASQIMNVGSDVVLDLGFMRVSDRNRFIDSSNAASREFKLHYVTASHAIRRTRVLNRNTERGETFAFEVTPMMFDFMEKQCQSPTETELLTCNQICTD